MVNSPKIYADQYLEMIALMSKRWVQIEWPTLLPVKFSPLLIFTYLGADILPLVGLSKCYKLRFRGFEEAVQKVQVHVPIR